MASLYLSGWTRVLYSTRVKLFPWIPSFVVKFITTKALVEVSISKTLLSDDCNLNVFSYLHYPANFNFPCNPIVDHLGQKRI